MSGLGKVLGGTAQRENIPIDHLQHISAPPKGPCRFAEKRCVLTGASSGIGRAIAMWLLNEGAYVALVGRDLKALSNIGQDFPSQAIVIQCDLGVDLQQYDMFKTVIEKLGGDKFKGIDILINCAGIIFDGDCQLTYPHDYDYCMDINLRSIYHITQCFVHYLEMANGCVVNVSSLFGHQPASGCISYCMSKAGLEMLTKCAALELGPTGVRVNAVAPGATKTNFMRYAGLTELEYQAWETRVCKRIPLKKVATPEEIAKSVIFLCSQKARKITGQVMLVDGGRHLTSSGYCPWEGQIFMNRRFEPDGQKWGSGMKQKFTDYLSQKSPIWSPEWIQESCSLSNWGSHLEEAHIKVAQIHRSMEADKEKIKYMGGDDAQKDAEHYKQAKKVSEKTKNSMKKFKQMNAGVRATTSALGPPGMGNMNKDNSLQGRATYQPGGGFQKQPGPGHI